MPRRAPARRARARARAPPRSHRSRLWRRVWGPASLGALAHLAALLLQAAGTLLLPLPPEHRARLLVGVRLVRHCAGRWALGADAPRLVSFPPRPLGVPERL